MSNTNICAYNAEGSPQQPAHITKKLVRLEQEKKPCEIAAEKKRSIFTGIGSTHALSLTCPRTSQSTRTQF